MYVIIFDLKEEAWPSVQYAEPNRYIYRLGHIQSRNENPERDLEWAAMTKACGLFHSV